MAYALPARRTCAASAARSRVATSQRGSPWRSPSPRRRSPGRPVDADRTAIRWHFEADLDVEGSLDLALLHSDLGVGAVEDGSGSATRGTRAARASASRGARSSASARPGRTAWQLVGRSRCGQHRPRKKGEVSTTMMSYDSRATSSRRPVRLGDQLGVLGRSGAGGCRARTCASWCSPRASRSRARPGDDQVVDGLLRLEPEHDRGVAELQVEVEEERPLLLVLGERGGEVRRRHGLARPALRREHGHDPPLAAV